VAIHTRNIPLDGSGAGTVSVMPCLYAGTYGAGTASVSNQGRSLTTGFLKAQDFEPINGSVTVAGGTPSGSVTLYTQY
jgi:hypothetical protein